MSPAAVVNRFYEAFARGDAAGMAACYHPEATFEDPAFGPLDRAAVHQPIGQQRHQCGLVPRQRNH